MAHLPDTYFLLEADRSDLATSEVAILPVPFERTTSYAKGTVFGPDAIRRASWYVELYDDELDLDPSERGIASLPAFHADAYDLAVVFEALAAEARGHLAAGKFLVTLGGEHSLTQAPVFATRDVHGEIGVVQFDAHADLRDTYEGTPLSHACVMHRIVDAGIPTLAVGLRALTREERELIRERDLPTIWGRELEGCEARFEALLDRLPEKVYLTFDVDFFDPSLLPATGTPEPGGGFWTPTMRLLRRLFEKKHVVAMDVVELAPQVGQHASDFVAAKLVYKCLGYRLLRR